MRRPTLVMLRPLGLGDFLTGVPAYRALVRAFPHHRIVLAASARYTPLATLVGGIDGVVDTSPLRPLAPELRDADVAVDLHGRGPASHSILLAASPGRLIAFENTSIPESRGGAPWFADEHEVPRWCRMLAHAGIRADAGDLRLDGTTVPGCERYAGTTVVHPGAASASRRWPPERWIRVIRRLSERGHHIVVTGNADEAALAEHITRGAGLASARALAGETTLLELAAIIARARAVVCGDTGVAHLATAFGRPSVVLFGPVSPAHWGPPPGLPHRTLWAGRHGDPHGAQTDPGLLEIAVDDVLREVAALPDYQTPALAAGEAHMPAKPSNASGSLNL